MNFLSKIVSSPGWYVFWGLFSLFFFVVFAIVKQPLPAAIHAGNVILQIVLLRKYLQENLYVYRRD